MGIPLNDSYNIQKIKNWSIEIIRSFKNTASHAIALIAALLLTLSYANARPPSQHLTSNLPTGVYTVILDNKVIIEERESGFAMFKSVYAIGIALDASTLVIPLDSFKLIDDAENKQFMFYYLDIPAGLFAMITMHNMETTSLAQSGTLNKETRYRILHRIEEGNMRY